MLPRLLVALLVSASVVGGCAGPAHAPAGAVPARFAASDVLRSWDEARARAFADGDVAALRGLYVPGSAAGTADVAMLRAYLDRGLRVEGLRMQVLSLDVLAAGEGRMRLRVTDRLAEGAVAVGRGSSAGTGTLGAGTGVPLPGDAASTHVVDLVRSGDLAWRVVSVRE